MYMHIHGPVVVSIIYLPVSGQQEYDWERQITLKMKVARVTGGAKRDGKRCAIETF